MPIQLSHIASVLSLLLLFSLPAAAAAQQDTTRGLAAAFPADRGLAQHKDVLLFEDYEGKTPKFYKPGKKGRSLVKMASPAGGKQVMASHNLKDKHAPWDSHVSIAPCDTVYYRFYSRFEPGYEMGGGVKGPGVSAKRKGNPGGGTAGIKPKGDDKFSARICFNKNGQPYIYYYHMDMGRWGSNANQHIGTPVSMQPGQWYCLEMMLQANDPDKKNGVLKLWIDGALKVHKQDIRFRTIDELKINWANHSAYFGGNWTSPKDQDRFEDNMVAARSYIGPVILPDK